MRILSALLVAALPLLAPASGIAGPPDKSASPLIEVAFVLDATGSMGPYIRQARERIRSIASDLAVGNPAPKVRYALVAYRDKSDQFVTRVANFTEDISEMKKRLEATRAHGGGDTPEAVLEGVAAAIRRLAWSGPKRQALRLIYLVGDAPAKHYGVLTEKRLSAEARKKDIVIHTIACGNGGLPSFDALARLTEGRALRLRDRHRSAHAIARSGRGRGRGSGAGPSTSGLHAAVSGTARAYSSSVGVDYSESGPEPIEFAELSTDWPGGAEPNSGPSAGPDSGLLGHHARWIRDPIAWGDVWAAHTSLLPAKDRPPLPEVDFTSHHVLVFGGKDAGLELQEMVVKGPSRRATLKPIHASGVAFALVAVPQESRETKGDAR